MTNNDELLNSILYEYAYNIIYDYAWNYSFDKSLSATMQRKLAIENILWRADLNSFTHKIKDDLAALIDKGWHWQEDLGENATIERNMYDEHRNFVMNADTCIDKVIANVTNPNASVLNFIHDAEAMQNSNRNGK